MERKARENLDASRRLLASDDPCTNAACNRAYYAAYHACWTAMVERGHPVPETERGRYFLHKQLPMQAQDAGILTEDQRDDLELLEGWRVTADYQEDDMSLEVAQESERLARALVESLLGNEEPFE